MKYSLKNKNVLVYGLGKSGIASYELLKTVKANVITYDDKKFPSKALDIDFEKLDFAVVSPGISHKSEFYQKLVKENIKIVSEIELANKFLKGKKVAITGTNGKTTTISLLGYIFKSCSKKIKQKNIFVAGNVGVPLASVCLKTKRNSISFIELSSFQLENIDCFNADIASILNIAPDHLDRYENINEYVSAKENIFKNQSKNQIAILNYCDKYYDRFCLKCKGEIYTFSINDESQNYNFRGIFYRDERLYFKDKNIQYLLNVKNVQLIGSKNLENILVAVLISYLEGLEMKKVENALNKFTPLENRLEVVKVDKKITYINDSKATNIASAVADINAIDGELIVLLGGSDKGENFINLASAIKNNKKIVKIIIFGATKDKIEQALKLKLINNYIVEQKFEDAVLSAKRFVKNYDKKISVLLSPACASFDEFENYIERGKMFKKLVILDNKKEV